MSGWWVAQAWSISPVVLVAWTCWVIGSIVLHELAHGWEAIRRGDRTPIETGHMTLNPLVHMGTTSLIVFALIGIAWGMMPVDPSRMRGRYADAAVSVAGPLMNGSLALLAAILLAVWTAAAGGYWWQGVSVPDPLFGNVQDALFVGVELNIVLMVFNLIPVPPLDGSRILADVSAGYRRLMMTEQGRMLAVFGFLAIFFFGAGSIWAVASTAADVLVHTITHAIAPAVP